MFNPLHNSTNQKLFEKPPCNQYGQFLLQKEATAKLIYFTVSKDEWDTKEDTGTSMKNKLYILQYAQKGTSQTEAISHSEKIKPVASAVMLI